MEPILDELLAASINDTPTTRRIQALLELIPLKPFGDIVDILSVRKTYSVLRDNPQETVVDFELAPGLPVRLSKYNTVPSYPLIRSNDTNWNERSISQCPKSSKLAMTTWFGFIKDNSVTLIRRYPY
jgi:hypothetical protein